MEKILQKNVIKTIALFIASFGIIVLVFTNIITMSRYQIAFIYFLTIIILFVWHFKKIFKKMTKQSKWHNYLTIIGSALLVHGLTLLDNFFLFTKPIEVLWQQIMIIILTHHLSKLTLTLKQIIIIFMIAFGSMHIFQAIRADTTIGIGFTIVALIFSAIFPTMILKVKNGYLYNYFIHLATYSLAALLVRLL